MAHPISVPEPRVDVDFLLGSRAGKTNGDALSRMRQPRLDHYAQPALAQSSCVSFEDDRFSGMTHFRQHDRQVDFYAGESPHAVRIRGPLGNGPLLGASEVPIVMKMLGLTNQVVTNPALADATKGELFASNDDRFVRNAMRSEMPHAIDAAYGRKFARNAE